ncbi:MAG: hypothetical protein H0W90_16395 [Actinobacteria bacterium]|nr:hypothetical protein [Actinomycetota bacterium]
MSGIVFLFVFGVLLELAGLALVAWDVCQVGPENASTECDALRTAHPMNLTTDAAVARRWARELAAGLWGAKTRDR